jgi:HK97 family phage major capsid protein
MQRRKAFAGGEQRAERCGHWLKALAGIEASKAWCIENRIPLTKASGESIGGGGGFLTPISLDSEIFAVRDTVGAFRNGEVRPVNSDSQVRPRRVGGLTAYFVAEGQPMTESQMLFDAIGANLKKFGVFTRVSSELFEDGAADLAAFFAEEVGYAFAAKEDDCGFNGDGTSTYSGITGLGAKLVGVKSAVTAASGHNTFLTLDGTDLASLMAGVLATAIPGARWYCSAFAYAQTFARLGGASGGLVARQMPDGSVQASYLGFPVQFSSQLPNVSSTLSGKPMLYFGDLRLSSVVAEHRSRTVLAMSAERFPDQDQVAVRGTRREDLINHSVGDAGTYGPIAVLIGN